MSEKKEQHEIEPPIIVNAGADAEKIGRHYANLHQTETGGAYKKLGINIKTKHITEVQPDGTKVVRIIEERDK